MIFRPARPAVIGRITAVARQAPSVYQVDVADTAGLQTVLDREQPGCGAPFCRAKIRGGVRGIAPCLLCEQSGGDLVPAAVYATRRVKRLIVSSSAAVYGTQDVSPLTERAAVGGCASPYGWSKFMLEQIVRDEAAARGDFSAVLLRYFNPARGAPQRSFG